MDLNDVYGHVPGTILLNVCSMRMGAPVKTNWCLVKCYVSHGVAGNGSLLVSIDVHRDISMQIGRYKHIKINKTRLPVLSSFFSDSR